MSFRADRTSVRRSLVLTGALRERDGNLVELLPTDHTWLAPAARYHRIGPYVLRRYLDQVTGTPTGDALAKAGQKALRDHLRALAALRGIGTVLEAGGIPVLVLKGPALAERLHGSPDLRPYNDLDLLVRGIDLGPAVDLMAPEGWLVLDRNWELLNRVTAGQLHLNGPYGIPVDLHWQLVFRHEVRRQFPIRVAELFDRSRHLNAGGVRMRTLDEVDTLLHLCLHAAQSGGHRLVWLKDVERAVTVDRPAWDEVVDRARRRRLGLACALILGRARSAAGAEVPDDVLAELASPIVRRTFWMVDRLAPAQKSTSRGSPARLLAKSVRGSGPETTVELARRVVSVRARAWHYLRHPGARPDSTADLMRPAGLQADAEAYLRSVAADDARGRSTK